MRNDEDQEGWVVGFETRKQVDTLPTFMPEEPLFIVIKMAINDMIRHFRKAQRIRQVEMSKQLNVHIDTYRRWEEGKHSIKSEMLLDIARVLGVTVKDITGRE